MKTVIVFGGSGFVGTHLVPLLLTVCNEVVIADIKKPCWHHGTSLPEDRRIKYVFCDIRKRVTLNDTFHNIDAIINLAAIHTTPGHQPHEYFEANVLGAQNICSFAEAVCCNRIVFTSSISVYGPGEDEKHEELIPMPEIPYGSSKIIAEYIHREWFNASVESRSLTILRPGVIFGKGEGGNFTRIANALQSGFFAYPGRTDTIKACLYVKDICAFIIESLMKENGYDLFNFCYPQKHTIKEIVQTFKTVFGYRAPELVIPFKLIASGASIVNMVPIPFIQNMGFVPERIRKLVRSTNISSQKLVRSGFNFRFSLETGLEDWAYDCGGNNLY